MMGEDSPRAPRAESHLATKGVNGVLPHGLEDPAASPTAVKTAQNSFRIACRAFRSPC